MGGSAFLVMAVVGLSLANSASCVILPSTSAMKLESDGGAVSSSGPQHKYTWLDGWKSGRNGCFCANDTCACCQHLHIPKLHINDTGCMELVYLRQEYGMSVVLVVDSLVLVNKTVSVHNPPALCYAVPNVSAADLCVRFYDLDLKKKTLSGCIAVEATIASIQVYHRNIGCFKFPIYLTKDVQAEASKL